MRRVGEGDIIGLNVEIERKVEEVEEDEGIIKEEEWSWKMEKILRVEKDN